MVGTRVQILAGVELFIHFLLFVPSGHTFLLGNNFFFQLTAPFLESLSPTACKRGIKSKAGAIKRSKERKIPRQKSVVTFHFSDSAKWLTFTFATALQTTKTIWLPTLLSFLLIHIQLLKLRWLKMTLEFSLIRYLDSEIQVNLSDKFSRHTFFPVGNCTMEI